MSTKPKQKGSYLAQFFPKLFGVLNDSNIDQAQIAELENEAEAAVAVGKEQGLENPEALAEPDTENATEDDELTKLRAQVTELQNTNASLKTENTKFKSQHKAQVAAGVTLPNEDASVRNAQEAPAFASDSPMGIALSRFQK
ncbi:hypothetical protein [Siphonobacter sp. SORGH_AS_1065]|uniref:hypothetical protein n=1 Tax=Siphonobacter sp. SORGH_AS_1065 TaxID=3041795 RepID=UPI00278B1C40|nr:hypothetical protein [Siphonobacter sp. SORGH_AS_1065]MDQ1085639.1 hypothetical protein [Siphonobacter sp. SORGH_AS_1065]